MGKKRVMWYEGIGYDMVARCIYDFYEPGVQARSVKFCWRKFCKKVGFMSFHTFLRYSANAVAEIKNRRL